MKRLLSLQEIYTELSNTYIKEIILENSFMTYITDREEIIRTAEKCFLVSSEE